MTSFSSRSRFVDIAAPGDDITVATALDDSWAPEAGTSFSSPLVAGAAAWVWTVRPELDASQLFEVMRRSAVDIDAPGRDDASGFGLLNVPAALAYAAPVPDPLEPNDDMDYVTPGKTFDNGIPPLTTKAKPSTTLTAPAHDRARTRVTCIASSLPPTAPSRSRCRRLPGSALGLWTPATQTVMEATPTKDRVAHGVKSNGTVTLDVQEHRCGADALPRRHARDRACATRRTDRRHAPAERAAAAQVAANARTVNVPAPSIFGGTAVNAKPSAGRAARLVRCSTIGMPSLSRIECTGRSPVEVPSMLSESMPTQATSCAHERLRRLGREVRVALEVAVGAEVLRVVGAHEHRVPGQPLELVVGQRDRLAVAAVEEHGR